MDKGVRLICTGLALTHARRKQKIELINANINAVIDSIRSASDLDGMPHSGIVTDPVSAKAIRVEALEELRDAEQERVNAIEWAEQCLIDRCSEEDSEALLGLLWTALREDRAAVEEYIEMHAISSLYVAQRVKTMFLQDVAKYLRLTDY